jgi:hypothetical protein
LIRGKMSTGVFTVVVTESSTATGSSTTRTVTVAIERTPLISSIP